MNDRINLDDPNYNQNQQVVIQNNKAKIVWIILAFLVVGIIIVTFLLSNGENNKTSVQYIQNSHDNCMFIGYADPNRKLDGNTIISSDPKYGYRPVYVDRDDIYNTYHFH